MSNALDVRLLIAEVQKRPGLWNFQHEDYKSRQCVPKLWNEVAEKVGIDVVQCKRKWKNLRDAYRAEVKRSKRRIKRDKLMGIYEPKNNYISKWIYFPYLGFISESKPTNSNSIENENTNSNSNDNIHSENFNNESMYHDNFDRIDIKMEPGHDADDSLHLVGDDDTASDMLFEEFQNAATPQAAQRLSTTLLTNNTLNENFTPQHAKGYPSSSNTHSCQCFKRSSQQVHFLQDLGREESNLMKSTREDITRSNELDHIGDSDYNFLISFLPHMKKLSELQNLRFRAKMCDTLLNILTPEVPENCDTSSVKQQSLTNNNLNNKQSMNAVHSTSCINIS